MKVLRSIGRTKKQLASLSGITILLCAEALLMITSVRATTARPKTVLTNLRQEYYANNDAQAGKLFLARNSAQPYVGSWSNGRGETLLITPNQIKFGNDRKLSYKDITRATDGTSFNIQITNSGKINYFQKFLFLKVDGQKLKMTGYNSYKDLFAAQNPGLQVTWYRDSR